MTASPGGAEPLTPAAYSDVVRSLAATLREVDDASSSDDRDDDFEDRMPQLLDMLDAGRAGQPGRCGQFDGFRTMGGGTAEQVEGVTCDDTPSTQAEGLGKVLEEALEVLKPGLFLSVYRLLRDDDGDGYPIARPRGAATMRRRRGGRLMKARRALGPAHAHLLHLMAQLIQFTHAVNAQQAVPAP